MSSRNGIENIVDGGGNVLAVVARSSVIEDKTFFFCPDSFSIQGGFLNRASGDYVAPHAHKPFESLTDLKCGEMMYVIRGRVVIGIYHEGKRFTERTLSEGDLIVLNTGHDFRCEDDARVLVAKQGPYREGEKVML